MTQQINDSSACTISKEAKKPFIVLDMVMKLQTTRVIKESPLIIQKNIQSV